MKDNNNNDEKHIYNYGGNEKCILRFRIIEKCRWT